jgi:hypothetical protein
MDLPEALKVLGLRVGFTSADLTASFRREASRSHPDQGGDPEAFDRLVQARELCASHLTRRRNRVVIVEDRSARAVLNALVRRALGRKRHSRVA